MSGQKGQRGPHTFRCYACKRGGGCHRPEGRNVGTNWRATGEIRRAGKHSHEEAEYQCLDCGHKGWSRHERVLAMAKL